MVKKVLIAVVSLVVLGFVIVGGVASMQPAEYRVVRSIEVNAPAATVFAQIADLKKWTEWSPWAKKDPNMVTNYSETTTGVGAFAAWESKTEGTGKQTISHVVENQELHTELEFYKPWEGEAKADFVLEDLGDNRTRVTWGMNGKNDGMVGKFFFAIMDFDAMIGKDYEAGLNDIKQLAEAGAAAPAETTEGAADTMESGEATEEATEEGETE